MRNDERLGYYGMRREMSGPLILGRHRIGQPLRQSLDANSANGNEMGI
jgi:hypothetical protein